MTLVAPEELSTEKHDEKATNWQIIDGAIRFNEVSLRYPDAPDLALKQLSMDLKAGQRIGICGALC